MNLTQSRTQVFGLKLFYLLCTMTAINEWMNKVKIL